MRRGWVAAMALPLLAGAAWAAGFGWFLRSATTPTALPAHADAILALTGGAERVETALRLLADGRARLLLVSGVGGPTEFAELARRAGVSGSLHDRVTLGRAAASTRGNAQEAAMWARRHDVRSMIVVTAYYHMPRALAELARTLPAVALHPAPVGDDLLPNPASLRLLAAEYTKFLGSELGLSGWVRGADLRPTERADEVGTLPETRSGG